MLLLVPDPSCALDEAELWRRLEGPMFRGDHTVEADMSPAAEAGLTLHGLPGVMSVRP